MSESRGDYPHIRDKPVNVDPQQALFVEYQEAGEEFRNYERLLNQSYYLSAIIFTFFIGALANVLNQNQSSDSIVVALMLIASVIFVILGLAGKSYHERRRAAVQLRDQIASDIHELTDSNVPRIQKVVIGGGPVSIELNAESRKRGIFEMFSLWKGSFLLALLALISIPVYIAF